MGFFDFLKRKDFEDNPDNLAKMETLDNESKKEKIIRILDNFTHDDLNLGQIQLEAETVFTYLNYLSNAINSYVGDNDYSKVEARLRGVQEHSKKLSHLLDNMIILYYNRMVDALSDVNDIEFSREVDNIHLSLGREKRDINELIELMARFESATKMNISSMINNGEIAGLIESLAGKLNKVLLGKESIRMKIRREDPIEVVRSLIVGGK